jgi:hypothetical protein
MVQWIRISDQHPPQSGELYLYHDSEGGYGVGIYEIDDYFFEPGSGEVQAVWWAEFNKVEEE